MRCVGSGGSLTGLPPKAAPFRMRAQCSCGSVDGYITERGAQDVVRCSVCDTWQYNAPRVETGKAVRSVASVHDAINGRKRAEILQRAHWRCEACGRKPSKDTDELHVSHVISVKRALEGGLSDAQINSNENLMCLCANCNLGIRDDVVPLWLAIGIVMARTKEPKK